MTDEPLQSILILLGGVDFLLCPGKNRSLLDLHALLNLGEFRTDL